MEQRQANGSQGMIRLEPAAFGSVAALPLWAGLEIHLAVASVLAGTTPGRVYVDDSGAPANALLQTGGRFYLAGSPAVEAWRRGLRSFFLDLTSHQGSGSGGFGLFYGDAGWKAALDEVLAGTDHLPAQRVYLELAVEGAAPPPPLPPGMRLRSVDRDLLAEERLGRLEELLDEMASECPSAEFFVDHRFGVALEAEGRLAGWCLSEFNVGDRCEVGIETAPEHRRRGLGTALALALACQARELGIGHIGWHASQANQASTATALRAGFRHMGSYPAHVLLYGRHDSRTKT